MAGSGGGSPTAPQSEKHQNPPDEWDTYISCNHHAPAAAGPTMDERTVWATIIGGVIALFAGNSPAVAAKGAGGGFVSGRHAPILMKSNVEASKKGDWPELPYLKIAVAFLPSTLLAVFGLWQSRILYALSLVFGALLAGFVPPKRGFIPILVVASIIALTYYLNLLSSLHRLFR